MLPAHAADPADTILLNGKIVTLDDRFTVFQGVAIRASASLPSATMQMCSSARARTRGDRPQKQT